MVNRMMPHTLVLEDRARLAIKVLAAVADEDKEYMTYFHSDFLEDPARLRHSPWDAGTLGRNLEGMLMAKVMCGSAEGDFVAGKYRELMEKLIHDNGLLYRPAALDCQGYANFHDQPHVLGALTLSYMINGDQKSKDLADRMCEGLKKITFRERDCWFLPAVEYREDDWPVMDVTYMRTASDPAHINGRMLNHLTKYYEVTGNTDALELAENWARQVVYHSASYNPDGTFNNKLEYRKGHYHSRMITLSSVTRYAAFAGNADMLAWANKIFTWVLSTCTGFGWTPGGMDFNKIYLHEHCTLTDIVETGITLAKNGYPRHWHTVDRFVRNHLVEAQILDGSWIKSRDDKSMDVEGSHTHYRIGERMLGAFAGYSAPNDFCCNYGPVGDHDLDMQVCCLGAGTRGLFLAWSNIVTADEKSGRVFVNIPLNRATKWLDVYNYTPHENKVELTVNRDIRNLYVKTPDWARFHTIKARRETAGETLEWNPPSWLDTHIALGAVRRGDKITVTYPLRKVVTVEKAVDEIYNATWIGDDVVDIDPPGVHYPLYSTRKVYDKAPMTQDTLRHLDSEINW